MDISVSHAPSTFALENTFCTDVCQSRGGGCVEYTKDLCVSVRAVCRRVDWCIAHVAYRCKDW